MKTPTKLGTVKRFPAPHPAPIDTIPPIFKTPNWKGMKPTDEELEVLARENNFRRIRHAF